MDEVVDDVRKNSDGRFGMNGLPLVLGSYTFDLIFLDYDLADQVKGDVVAHVVRGSFNAEATVIVHAMNSMRDQRIKAILPRARLVPLSRFIRNNETFK